MAKSEKMIFVLLIALLGLGLWVKFHKLRQAKVDFTLIRDVKEIPRSHSVKTRPPSPKKTYSTPQILDLNLAAQEELAGLPHVGKSLAQKIVDHRVQHGPFQKKSDLLKVESVSISRYKKIEPYLTLR